MRILVVEDDKKVADFIEKGLEEEGWAVDVAYDGMDGYHLAATGEYDVAIVDVMLPELDGNLLVKRLREEGVNVPVLHLSAKKKVDDRIRGLRAGGDDYMTKPFSFSELVARIQALVRRATRTVEPTTLTAGDLTLDLLAREAVRGEETIPLQPREFALLEHLLRNRGRIVSKTSILEHVYDYNFDPQTNVVDVLVHRLRGKIDKGFDRKLIQTVRGAGYVVRP